MGEAPQTAAPLSHVGADGEVHMVDVSAKTSTDRRAGAVATVRTTESVVRAVAAGELPKGEALATAKIAGILAAKQTHLLIPLCHPLPLEGIEVDLLTDGAAIHIRAEVTTHARTGVEMEALTAVSIAALTVYDMIKAADPRATITDIAVIHKSGGTSGT